MGGKAFKEITRRIKKDEIKETLYWLQKKWPDHILNGMNDLDQSLLGSAGKNDDSGDLDLNLDITKFDQSIVANQLINILGADHVKPKIGNNQIFTAVPIKGDPSNGFVQIDFMFGDKIWQEFSYFSPVVIDGPGNADGVITSSFKGLYRTEFLKALTAYNSDWVLEENGEMIARIGPTFFHDKGLVWRYRYRPFKKNSKTERIQALIEVSENEFFEIFPSAFPASASVMKDPEEVSRFLYHDCISSSNLETLEMCWRYLRWYYQKDERDKIVKIYLERLNSLKVDIPVTKFNKIGIKVK